MTPLFLFGSARGDGDTKAALTLLTGGRNLEIIDLRAARIEPFEYNRTRWDDGFLAIATRMTEADTLVFVTPVYWYAMSGVMKHFFDRFTDLTTHRKDLGRRLAGKRCFLIAAGAGSHLPPGFEEPFKATCDYLDMEYKGAFYVCTRRRPDAETGEARGEAQAFVRRIFEGE